MTLDEFLKQIEKIKELDSKAGEYPVYYTTTENARYVIKEINVEVNYEAGAFNIVIKCN